MYEAFMNPVMLFLGAVLCGFVALCVVLARRLRREYDQRHPEGGPTRWDERMRAKGAKAWGQSEPVAQAEIEAGLQADAHPFLAGWAISKNVLPYSAVVATIARLASRRAIEFVTTDVTRAPDFDLSNIFRDRSERVTVRGTVVLVYAQRRPLVHDPLDLATFDLLVDLAEMEAKNLSKPSEVEQDLPTGAKCFFLSRLVDVAYNAPNRYRHLLQRLKDASAEAISAQGLNVDEELEQERERLRRTIIGCASFGGLVMLASVFFAWVPGILLPQIAWMILRFYCMAQRTHCEPITDEGLRLRRELDGLASWLDTSDGRDVGSLDEHAWRQMLLYAIVVGEGVEAGRLMRRVEPELSERVDFAAMLEWCSYSAWIATEAFVEATRHAYRSRTGPPAPQQYY